MNQNNEWKPLSPEMKLGLYSVLFEGGHQGIAALTPRSWMIIEDSIFRDKEANIIAHKPFSWKPLPKGDKR